LHNVHGEMVMIQARWLGIACALALHAGFAIGATPRPEPQSFSGNWRAVDQLQTKQYGALDLDAVAAEDALRETAGNPHRFAIPHDESLDIRSTGSWEQQGELSIWRYRIKADQAASINVGFTRFHVPPSARLYLYDSARKQVAGPYDAKHNEPHAQLWTPVIASSDVIVELNVATAERNQVELVIGRIGQGYRGLGSHSKGYSQPDLGQPKLGGKTCSPDQINSGRCNMDVACLAEDDPWNDPRRAVGAIQLNGSDDCTGSLVNNTAGDRRMLFITATHCGLTPSSSPSTVVYWNYEWPTCRTPGSTESGQSNPPDPNMSSSGATHLANTGNPFGGCSGATCSDNTLVELDDAPNPDWNLFWAGWDRRTTGAACSQSADPSSTDGLCASIHHPNVDEKRITFVAQDLEVGGISGGTNTHWHAFWDPTPPILANIPDPQPTSLPPGVTEPGSSGSPLYTSAQRLVGVLSGGPSACGATGANLSDFYGQLALAWDGTGTPTTRLKDYLDPLGGEPDFIDGIGLSPFTLALDPPTLAVCATAGSATVDVAVTADVGFSGTVDLTASGEPPGSTATLNPTSVAPPGNSVLTIGSLASATPGTYTVTVTGTSGSDSTQKTLAMSLNDAAPAAVTLSVPADNAVNVGLAPTLSWSAASSGGPTDYLVEVASDSGFSTIVFSQTVHDDTSVAVTPSLNSLTTYYWRVTASNTCGGGTASAVFQFTTLAAPGTCTPPTTPNTLFSDDVENGDNGWTTTGSAGDSTWVRSSARPNSGSFAWYAEDLDSNSDQRLISPSIALPADQNPITLKFENWREIEDNAGTACYDGAIVEVSTDGTNFTQVPDSSIIGGGNYTGIVDDGFNNVLMGLPAWCGRTARPYTDGPVLIDLTNYAGQNVQLRFRLASDDSVGFEGWYVDDVNVTSCQGETTPDTIFQDGFELPTR